MKRLLCLFTAILLALSLLPVTSFAMESNDKDFEAFLEEIGWEKQDYIDYLESKDWYLEDFESADELGTPLTEESIEPILTDYDLTREELNELLADYGDIEVGQDVLDSEYLLFAEEVYDYVGYYLDDTYGTLINDENLQELVERYGFASADELEEYLQQFDESIDHYEFIEDLDSTVDYYMNGGADLEAEIDELFLSMDLTEEEMDRLLEHFITIYEENPDFEDQLYTLSERMMAFGEFDSADDLTAEQIAELLDISNDMLDILQLDVKYYLVKDGVKKPLSVQSMMTMTSTDGADLLIELYNKQGDFLADIILTNEMFGSEIIKETGKDLQEAEQIVKEIPVKTATKAVEKTVKGGKLPNTASDYLQNTIIGLVIVLAGVVLFRRVWVKGQ
ncbi:MULTISPECIES: processed acidic surface protein [unclassified Niallia]|uniref:processed acidic surface protein n=1 Tax=Niallia TaxID=2837506 RepID=UPI001EDB86D8|nr:MULTISPECIES: processed acidic surface protein [unclassified Niallia]MDL0437686.1 processed acidic surface protein [Niallia sp. SS-2023]UPO87323.1 processed acidic surface protein [Niallia sp. Man26]